MVASQAWPTFCVYGDFTSNGIYMWLEQGHQYLNLEGWGCCIRFPMCRDCETSTHGPLVVSASTIYLQRSHEWPFDPKMTELWYKHVT